MNRKPRGDSKLHSLPPEHRTKVNRWLFDKGLTYQQVVDACLQMLNLKVSRSSVGRYFQRETLARLRQTREAELRAKDADRIAWFTELSPEQKYQTLLSLLANEAWEALTRPNQRDLRGVAMCLRLLIAARRERTKAMLASLHRRKFELWAAKKVFNDCRRSLGRERCPHRAASRAKLRPQRRRLSLTGHKGMLRT